jgi:hypothetical protein
MLTFSPFLMHSLWLLTDRNGCGRFWGVEMLFGSQHLCFPAQAWGAYNSSHQNDISKPIILTFSSFQKHSSARETHRDEWWSFFMCSCPQFVGRRVQPHEPVMSLMWGMLWWWWVIEKGLPWWKQRVRWCAGGMERERWWSGGLDVACSEEGRGDIDVFAPWLCTRFSVGSDRLIFFSIVWPTCFQTACQFWGTGFRNTSLICLAFWRSVITFNSALKLLLGGLVASRWM